MPHGCAIRNAVYHLLILYLIVKHYNYILGLHPPISNWPVMSSVKVNKRDTGKKSPNRHH